MRGRRWGPLSPSRPCPLCSAEAGGCWRVLWERGVSLLSRPHNFFLSLHVRTKPGWWWFNHSVVPRLCTSTNGAPMGSSVLGISQARTLEWVAISFSRGSSGPWNQTLVSCIAGVFFANWVSREAPKRGRRCHFCLIMESLALVESFNFL